MPTQTITETLDEAKNETASAALIASFNDNPADDWEDAAQHCQDAINLLETAKRRCLKEADLSRGVA